MTNKQKGDVLKVIEENGFWNTFIHQTRFPLIADQEFHNIRRRFLVEADNLALYIGYIEREPK